MHSRSGQVGRVWRQACLLLAHRTTRHAGKLKPSPQGAAAMLSPAIDNMPPSKHCSRVPCLQRPAQRHSGAVAAPLPRQLAGEVE